MARDQKTGPGHVPLPRMPEMSRPPPPTPRAGKSSMAREAAAAGPLGLGADISAFLDAGVPGQLHREAMRRHWHSDPMLASLGACDPDEDAP
ncbi:DUF3306 domain-containing protein [Rhodovulum sulfidophilum]|uniref:DUF3306 domain-containing protein n=1 Tax=Rhodovulum sulfidophilum TaxID=35806 RepID=UPI0019221953|nr:DUF3306 domain-containing protein [Rhodovulum sulfidophilum]MBL3564949.1 DUF3306 domain-containing protein [Rhodovulum sulfidophilum]